MKDDTFDFKDVALHPEKYDEETRIKALKMLHKATQNEVKKYKDNNNK